ncbi:pyridoxal phosphate homeostasis protein-like isoform X1 [Mya arenaria]|uniref:pyridoxal phosphate homeostasis protein-like isoform X1 n=1 Tax=Mya arenaria TaxID=6604 RepID=UPI0022DEEE40|nr:pyridoxal phosphate homeostasis protein-like isoform X1 [Mya arenaria]
MFRKMATNPDEVGKSLKVVLENIQKAVALRPKSLPDVHPRLVAVTKTKPVSDIIAAYSHGQRHFGENYVQELCEKSNDTQLQESCAEIKWHFIGHLQRNKANKIAVLPNLYMVETVDSQKLAQTLNNVWEKHRRTGKLKVMVQVNTKGEENKSGLQAGDVEGLTRFVIDRCPCLEFAGLMTIGSYGYDPADGPNPDFLALVRQREELCQALGRSLDQVELSMGMSTDYMHSIELGSTNVRVGSTIFGARNYPQKPGSQSKGSSTEGNQSDSTSDAGASSAVATSENNSQSDSGAKNSQSSAGSNNQSESSNVSSNCDSLTGNSEVSQERTVNDIQNLSLRN